MSDASLAPPLAGLHLLAARYDVILCDVWGVVHDGRNHLAAAAAALMRFRAGGGTVVLVTNAPRPRAPIQAMLDSFKTPRSAYDSIISSGDVTAALVAAYGAAPVHHIGPARDLALFAEVAARTGVKPPLAEIAAAAYVVCTGLFDDFDSPDIYMPALRAMKARELPMICANPDIVVHSGPDLLWCAGALAERYETLGGRIEMAGKPYRAIYDAALAQAQILRAQPISRTRVLAIGDGLFTDIAGAAAQGFDSLFITTGVHRQRLHPNADRDDWRLDAAAYADLLEEAGAAPTAHMRDLTWSSDSPTNDSPTKS